MDSYHGLAAHDEAPEAPRCVACHAVHETDGDAFAYFMARPRVDRQCRACHERDDVRDVPSLVSPLKGPGG